MPANHLGPLLIVFGPPIAWLAAYTVVLVATRVRQVRPAPPTPDLGPEPPALVNLLLNQNDVTEDAAEATLLDLAARRIIELRAADANPMHTTVHIRVPDPPELTRYERRVLERVKARAVNGVAPLTALTFSDPTEADRWMGELRREVVQDARVRGLAANRLSGALGLPFLFLACGIPFTTGFGAALWGQSSDPNADLNAGTGPRFFIGGCVGVVVFFLFFYIVLRLQALRLSRMGRHRAAHWLGVRDWLAAHPSFAELPPAATAVWDRYLAYGAALGTTTVASRTIHLGLGRRRTPWSSYGGQWRRVRVRRLGPGQLRGLPAPVLVIAAAALVAAGVAWTYTWRPAAASGAGVAVGVAGLYLLARVVVDAGRPTGLTGQVLWVEAGRGLRYPMIAIDDGAHDETRPWIAPERLVRGVYGGDVVRATGRLWRRRITELAVISRGADWMARQAGTGERQSMFRAIAPSAAGLRDVPIADVLPASEASAMLRQAVQAVPGKGRTVDYVSTVDGRPRLRIELLDRIGDADRWRARPAGWELAGVGDEAYFGHGWAVGRLGNEFVLLTSWPPADAQAPAEALRTVLPRLAA
jgi:hypothetical protein